MTDFVLDISNKAISWNSEEQQFSVELSDLEQPLRDQLTTRCFNRAPIRLKNPETKTSCTITFVKADMDGSQEDTYGWNYAGTSTDGQNRPRSFRFLFIND